MANLKVFLSSLQDSATSQYYHFKGIMIAGMGLFTDAYALFCIPPIMTLIGRIYYDQEHHAGDDDNQSQHYGAMGSSVPAFVSSISIAIPLLGTVFGQVILGTLGDRIGRKRVYGFALLLMIFSSIGCGFSFCRTRKCVITSLCFFRFLLGFGIGGDYPISATIMSEFANKTTRGSFIAIVFCMQGFGILSSSAVTMIFCSAFDRISSSKYYKAGSGDSSSSSSSSTSSAPAEADLVWRLILMFSAVPASMTYYWRMQMPDSSRYTTLLEQNLQQAIKNREEIVLDNLDVSTNSSDHDDEMSSGEELNEVVVIPAPILLAPATCTSTNYGLMSKEFFRRHGRDLFACSSTWFLLDIVFYSSNLFQSHIYGNLLRKPAVVNVYHEAFDVAKLQAMIAICSTIPGYWASVIFIDRIGRVKIQIMGFFFMAVCLFAIGIPYSKYWDNHTNVWFLILYSLTFFFSNFGPNTTTFIVPAELFPARYRSTCHGLSGAVGKMGAILGTVGFLLASQSNHISNTNKVDYVNQMRGIGMKSVLMTLGGICVLGMILTYLFTRETKGRPLEENDRAD